MKTRSRMLGVAVLAVSVFLAGQVMAAPVQINWWHAMRGARGEVVNKMVKAFNDSQKEFEVVATYKGAYDEVVNAGIAERMGIHRV